MTDLAYLTVAEGAELLRTRKLSPVEWTRALLDRIAAIDSHYNAFLVVTADKALAQAKLAEAEIAKGQWRGPMHGVPMPPRTSSTSKAWRPPAIPRSARIIAPHPTRSW